MKRTLLKNAQFLLLSFCIVLLTLHVQAQKKQYKAKLSASYYRVMGATPYIEVESKYKGENGYEPSANLELNVYHQLTEDSLVLVEVITTNDKGIARYELKKTTTNEVDSLVTHTYIIKIENNTKFKDAKKAVSFLDTSLSAEIVEIDSIYNIKATLTDGLGEPIHGEKLKINVQRLFAPLAIGKYYKTNSKGTVLLPLKESFPGVDGKLTFEVFIKNKKYGTVKYLLNTSIGEPVKDLSTYDDRTMWSPPGKTPVFLLIFPNLLMLGIGIVILLLVRNLYKIYKS